MSRYIVGIPVTMHIIVEVEADSEADAIDKGFEVEWTLDAKGCEVIEAESHRHVARGNVCSAVLNDAYVEKVDEN